MKYRLAIVVVAFNRVHSLARLLNSIGSCDIGANVDLVISIDYSLSQSVLVKKARSIFWSHGELIVRALTERHGLRDHILSCGDLTDKYDAVVILEDDVVVSNGFIDYVLAAIKFTQNDDRVAGISLYAPAINEMAMLPFTPKRTGFDNYYLQSAQSWGQCWTREMWLGFREWYNRNSSSLEYDDDMPDRIYSWPASSWKKYYMKYLVETGKTFFYPHDSYSSNYSDVGQHNKVLTPHFQVPLTSGKREFNFGHMHEVACYDIFFERVGLSYEGQPLCLDLYGTRKKSTGRYLLSTKKIEIPAVKSFGLTYRPQEDNYINNAPGCDIFLYDLDNYQNFKMKESYNTFKLANYHTNLGWRHALIYGLNTLKKRVFEKLKRK